MESVEMKIIFENGGELKVAFTLRLPEVLHQNQKVLDSAIQLTKFCNFMNRMFDPIGFVHRNVPHRIISVESLNTKALCNKESNRSSSLL